MVKAVTDHFELAEQKQSKIEDVKKAIEDNEQQLSDLQQDYKKAVANSEDEKTDSLFHTIEELEKKIKADKHKLQTLHGVTTDFLKDDAIRVVKDYPTMKEKHQKKADKALSAVEQAKKEYIKALDVLDGLNEDFQADSRKYWGLIQARGLTKHDVNTDNNRLFYEIEYANKIVPHKSHMAISSTDIEKEVK